MAQGNKKLGVQKSAASKNMGKLNRKLTKLKSKTKKGNPNQHGDKKRLMSGPVQQEEEQLTRAIGRASEEKVAAKLLQSGGQLGLVKDLQQKGKEINKQARREQLKKKVGRTEQKLNELNDAITLRDM